MLAVDIRMRRFGDLAVLKQGAEQYQRYTRR